MCHHKKRSCPLWGALYAMTRDTTPEVLLPAGMIMPMRGHYVQAAERDCNLFTNSNVLPGVHPIRHIQLALGMSIQVDKGEDM